MFDNIDYHVTDRCNRHCVSCGHFVPLVPNTVKNKPLDVIEEDFKALARFPGLSQHFTLTGGEPTLHPQLREILEMAINYFPDRIIRIVSNGTNPERIIDLKDIVFAHDNVKILLTNYDQEKTNYLINELGNSGHLFLFYVDKLGDDSKYAHRTKFHRSFICEEKCTTLKEATMCHHNTECLQLADKKLYACQYLAYYHYFQDYFKDKIKVFAYGDEGIELDKCNSNEDIENFIYGWIQNICLHCLDPLRMGGKYENMQDLIDTKYELDEWYIKSINNEEKKDDDGE